MFMSMMSLESNKSPSDLGMIIFLLLQPQRQSQGLNWINPCLDAEDYLSHYPGLLLRAYSLNCVRFMFVCVLSDGQVGLSRSSRIPNGKEAVER